MFCPPTGLLAPALSDNDDSVAYLHPDEVATAGEVLELGRKVERLEAIALRAIALQEEVTDLRQQLEGWENLVAHLRSDRERLHTTISGIIRLAGLALQI